MGYRTETSLHQPLCTKAADFRPELNRPYIVKNLLWPGEVGMLAGAPGLGKTTIVAALAAHVSQGRNFGGLAVKNSVVLYFAAEDPHGVLCRAFPYASDPSFATAPFYVVHDAPDLTDPSCVARITALCEAKKAEHQADRALVVFDTLNRCIGDADENSSSSMGAVVGNAGRIAQSANAAVLFVHHVGSSGSDRPRGSSAFEGNLDLLCMLNKAPENGPTKVVFLTAKKQKNAQEVGAIPFEVTSHRVGFDEDGEAVSVPVARPMEARALAKIASPANDNKKPRGQADARQEDVLRLMKQFAAQDPAGIVHATAVGASCGAAFSKVRDNPDSLRKAVKRALESLVTDGHIESIGEGYRVSPKAVSAPGTLIE
ncbi:AAA family ATPase [Pseudooceanicola sp. 502str34]